MDITLRGRDYAMRLVGFGISGLWLLLAGAILVVMAGAAGIGVPVGATLLPQLLAATIAVSLLVAFAAFNRRGLIFVALAGGILAVVVGASLSDWHPDYRPILGTAAVLALAAAGWAILALGRPNRANRLM